jgi:endonuclease YncB( thermonuclease family)
MKRRVVLALLTALLLPEAFQGDDSTAPAEKQPCVPVVIEQFDGRVVAVNDGDTVRVLTADKKEIRVRLEGIDAPELGQDHSAKAKEALSGLVFGQTVTVKKTGEDRYGRTLAYVFVGDTDVSAKLLEAGWAWHFKKYNCVERYADLEAKARGAKAGLWVLEGAVAPWDYRDLMAQRRQKAKERESGKAAGTKPRTAKANTAQKAEPAEKFWLNSGTGVRHNSSCQWFGNTKNGRYCGPNDGRGCKICGG